jgi:hypothetical protein
MSFFSIEPDYVLPLAWAQLSAEGFRFPATLNFVHCGALDC